MAWAYHRIMRWQCRGAARRLSSGLRKRSIPAWGVRLLAAHACCGTTNFGVSYMPLVLQLGDLLGARTDAILLAVDGMARNKPDPARPIRGGKEILGGNLASQFARRWPEDWEDLQLEIPFPILHLLLNVRK